MTSLRKVRASFSWSKGGESSVISGSSVSLGVWSCRFGVSKPPIVSFVGFSGLSVGACGGVKGRESREVVSSGINSESAVFGLFVLSIEARDEAERLKGFPNNDPPAGFFGVITVDLIEGFGAGTDVWDAANFSSRAVICSIC